MNSKKPKAKKDANSKDYLFSSSTGGRGKAVLDFFESFDSETTTYKQSKSGKFRKVKKKKTLNKKK